MSTSALTPAAETRPPAGRSPADRQEDRPELQRKAETSLGQQWFRSIWFASLMAAICFEGLGRRYLPQVPATAFYFLKDAVLVVGLIRFRINPNVKTVVRSLYGKFLPFLKLAAVWTFVEIFNPSQQSLQLGLLGFRAYWFWWLAPFVVASVLLDPAVRRKVVFFQSAVALIVALFALLQFNAPATDSMNTYTVMNGENVQAYQVGTTARARVSSTFAFPSGFTAFAILVPVLLLSMGLSEVDRKARLAALLATVLSAATLPMAGSRAPIVIAIGMCALVAWRAGLVFTTAGRRVIVLAGLAAVAMIFAFPEAIQGVMDRFEFDDTGDRFKSGLEVLPPVTMSNYDFPFFGLGTGMEQNYRGQFGISDTEIPWLEAEPAKYLFELGAIGYLLVWVARVGLVVLLWKASRILKAAGRRAAAGGALAYAALTFCGSITFDHYYSALYFVGLGFILQEVVTAWPVIYGGGPRGHAAWAVRATATAPAART
jgi:hypothetical protein